MLLLHYLISSFEGSQGDVEQPMHQAVVVPLAAIDDATCSKMICERPRKLLHVLNTLIFYVALI